MRKDLKIILSKPYAAPRAVYLSFIARFFTKLMSLGIAKIKLSNIVNLIEKNDGDSEIIRKICVEQTRARLQ